MKIVQGKIHVVTLFLFVGLGVIIFTSPSTASEVELAKAQVIARSSAQFGMSSADLEEEKLTVTPVSRANGGFAYHVVGQFKLGWSSPRNPDEIGQIIANKNRCAFARADCEPGIHHTIYVDVTVIPSQSLSNSHIEGKASLDKTIEQQAKEVAENDLASDPSNPSKALAALNPPDCNPLVVPRSTPVPRMPAQAIRARHTGTTVLQLLLNSDGMVQDARVYKSSGYRELDHAAAEVASHWFYSPIVCEGSHKPAMAAIRVPITFGFHNASSP